MYQIRGIKGEAVPPLAGRQGIDNKGDIVSSTFPQGKQNRYKIAYFISKTVGRDIINCSNHRIIH
jgi:hypothetical protein